VFHSSFTTGKGGQLQSGIIRRNKRDELAKRAGLLVFSVSAEAASQPAKKAVLVLYGERGRAKVSIHYSRVIFLGFTPAIQNFRPTSATNRNIPTCDY
jgi:hypothetical protein